MSLLFLGWFLLDSRSITYKREYSSFSKWDATICGRSILGFLFAKLEFLSLNWILICNQADNWPQFQNKNIDYTLIGFKQIHPTSLMTFVFVDLIWSKNAFILFIFLYKIYAFAHSHSFDLCSVFYSIRFVQFFLLFLLLTFDGFEPNQNLLCISIDWLLTKHFFLTICIFINIFILPSSFNIFTFYSLELERPFYFQCDILFVSLWLYPLKIDSFYIYCAKCF